MAFTNVQSDSDFVKIHFSRFFFWILEFCNNLQKRNLLRCRPRPAVHRCGVHWSPLLPNSSSPAAKFPANLIVAFYDWARRGPSPTASTGGSAAEGRGCNKLIVFGARFLMGWQKNHAFFAVPCLLASRGSHGQPQGGGGSITHLRSSAPRLEPLKCMVVTTSGSLHSENLS